MLNGFLTSAHLINSTFTSVGTRVFSFWSPSLGPTCHNVIEFEILPTHKLRSRFDVSFFSHFTSTILTDEGKVLMWAEERMRLKKRELKGRSFVAENRGKNNQEKLLPETYKNLKCDKRDLIEELAMKDYCR